MHATPNLPQSTPAQRKPRAQRRVAVALVAALAAVLAPPIATAQDPANPPENNGAAAADAGDLWRQLADRRAAKRADAFRQLVAQGEAVLPDVLEHLAHPMPRVRWACLKMLAEIAPEQSLKPLVASFDDDSAMVRQVARENLLRLYRPEWRADLHELAAAMRARDGALDADFERLLYIFDLRQLLAEFETWRTPRTPGGIRVPGQYADFMRRHPQAAETLIAFLSDSRISTRELGGLWTLWEAMREAVRALMDGGITEARPTLQALAERLAGGQDNLARVRQGLAFGDGDPQSLPQLVALAIYKLGGDMPIREYLDTLEMRLRSYPHFYTGYMLAATCLEIGEMRLAAWALRVTVKSVELGDFFGSFPMLPVCYLHLAAITLQQVAAIAAGQGVVSEEHQPAVENPLSPGEDLGKPDGPPSVELAMGYLKKALEIGFNDPQWLELDARFDAVRESPEFERLLALLHRLYPSDSND